MKRIGPWMVCVALALMALGVLSTPRPEIHTAERELRVDMAGITTVDIGSLSIRSITLQSEGPAVLRYEKNRRQRDEPDVNANRIDQTLVFSAGSKPFYYGQGHLTLPVDVASVKACMVMIEAKAEIDTLRIDAAEVNWTGNAKQLDVYLQLKRSSHCPERSGREANFDFSAGKVDRLRIFAPEASIVRLGDMGQVGEVELHASPDTRVNARPADFARLRVIPIGELPVPP